MAHIIVKDNQDNTILDVTTDAYNTSLKKSVKTAVEFALRREAFEQEY